MKRTESPRRRKKGLSDRALGLLVLTVAIVGCSSLGGGAFLLWKLILSKPDTEVAVSDAIIDTDADPSSTAPTASPKATETPTPTPGFALGESPHPPGTSWTNSIGMEFAWIPPGRIVTEAQQTYGQQTYEISDGFWMSKYETTQEDWRKLLSKYDPRKHGWRAFSDPSRFKSCGPRCPVENLGLTKALAFSSWLNNWDNLEVGWFYSIPDDTEWTYAALAGTTRGWPSNHDEIAWFADNAGSRPLDSDGISGKFRCIAIGRSSTCGFEGEWDLSRAVSANGNRTHRVGLKSPNAWGLYDMFGNVEEWTRSKGRKGGSFRSNKWETNAIFRNDTPPFGGVLVNVESGDPSYGLRVIIRRRTDSK